jgi:O-antigen/teichoic acid export membrane protein
MKFYDFNIGKSVLSLGGKFFIIQVFYLGLTGSNVFIISNVLSPIDVVEYQVYYRIFSLMGMLTMLLLTPFWSIITKAKEEKEWFWIKKYFNLFSILSILIFVLNISIMFLFQYIINIWLGDESFNANSFYLIVFGFYGWIFSIQAFVSVFANGFNRINNQLFIYTIGFIVKITMIYGFTLFIKNWGVIIFIDLIIFIVYDIFEYFSVKKYINFNIKIT